MSFWGGRSIRKFNSLWLCAYHMPSSVAHGTKLRHVPILKERGQQKLKGEWAIESPGRKMKCYKEETRRQGQREAKAGDLFEKGGHLRGCH